MTEHAVIIHLPMNGVNLSFEDAYAAIRSLEDDIEQALSLTGAGELDGNQFGAGEAVLFLYGEDAEALFAVVESYVRNLGASDAFAVLRFGPANDSTVQARRIDL